MSFIDMALSKKKDTSKIILTAATEIWVSTVIPDTSLSNILAAEVIPLLFGKKRKN